jgi:hypothetical protein
MPRPWTLPLIVAAVVVPVAAAFVLGGPGLGVAVGALVALAIAVVAVRARPEEPIEVAEGAEGRRILVVLSVPVEDPAAVRAIAAETGIDDPDAGAEVLVLAPARTGFLDRWASDVAGAREAAQRRLVLTVAALAKADVDAEGRVGDEDLVQATEDRLRSFAASEVVLATGPPEEDHAGDAAAAQLRDRLPIRFRRVVVGSSGSGG